LTTLMKVRSLEALACLASDAFLMTFRGGRSRPTTRAWPYGRAPAPSSAALMMTAFLPAWRPVSRMTTRFSCEVKGRGRERDGWVRTWAQANEEKKRNGAGAGGPIAQAGSRPRPGKPPNSGQHVHARVAGELRIQSITC
jgi:hypothetical protein